MPEQKEDYRLQSDAVDVHVTRVCGMLTADFGGIKPFSIAPWVANKEQLPEGTIPLLAHLQGDWDCLGFGGNQYEVNGMRYQPHGDTANNEWDMRNSIAKFVGKELTLETITIAPPGRVKKRIIIRDDEPIVYHQTMCYVDAKVPFGHHATLRMNQGAYDVSTSEFVYGGNFPGVFDEGEGKPILMPYGRFSSLDALPLVNGGTIQLNDYFNKPGTEDLVVVAHNPKADFAWSAMTNLEEKYVFFTLKDPRFLSSTAFWLSNKGRSAAPWNNRHGPVMGMEDVTAYYCLGVAQSLGENLTPPQEEEFQEMKTAGIKTVLGFNRIYPPAINYIMGCVPVDADFKGVERIEREIGLVTLVDKAGKHSVDVPVSWEWLHMMGNDTLFLTR